MMEILLNILIFCIGALLLYYGAEFLIGSGVEIAKRFGISTVIIGITVVAFGTSLPELIVSISASLKDESDIVLGNVIGSNIANIGLVLGVSAIITPMLFKFKKARIDLYIVGFVTLLFVLFLLNGKFYRLEGLIFILLLCGYCFHLYKKNNASDSEKINILHIKTIFAFIGGVAGLWVGSELFLKGALNIATMFGVSSVVIGMSLVALGTSLPELATSIVASLKGKTEIAIGNIIGSNLFNILAVMGITLIVKPFEFEFSNILVINTFMLIFFTLLLILTIKFKNEITRLIGFVLLFMYIITIYLTLSQSIV